jgi:hypothetical protein
LKADFGLDRGVYHIFQSIGVYVCNINQYIAPGVNICYDIEASKNNPNGVDMQFLDMIGGEYMHTEWTDSSTMVSKVEGLDGSCYQWTNDDWQATSTCSWEE